MAYLTTIEGKADSIRIAREAGIPRQFLLKILHTLKMNKHLESARGIGGGYWLAEEPGQISLYDVVGLFENVEDFAICPFGSEGCRRETKCPLHEGWSAARSQFITFLQDTTFETFKEAEFKDIFPNASN